MKIHCQHTTNHTRHVVCCSSLGKAWEERPNEPTRRLTSGSHSRVQIEAHFQHGQNWAFSSKKWSGRANFPGNCAVDTRRSPSLHEILGTWTIPKRCSGQWFSKLNPSSNVALWHVELSLCMWDDRPGRDYCACTNINRGSSVASTAARVQMLHSSTLGLSNVTTWAWQAAVQALCCISPLYSSHMQSKMWTTHVTLITPESGLANHSCSFPAPRVSAIFSP